MTIKKYQAIAASSSDIEGIERLLKHYAKMGNLLPRSRKELEDNLSNFIVIHKDDAVVACGSLENFSKELTEIRSLIVDPELQGEGLGKILVKQLIELAKQREAKRVMALTYSVGFFQKLGFSVVDKNIFPEKIWSICVNCYKFNNCDETAVLLTL